MDQHQSVLDSPTPSATSAGGGSTSCISDIVPPGVMVVSVPPTTANTYDIATATLGTTTTNANSPTTIVGVGIVHPEPDDIICGRGKSIAHKGNARFRQLINEKKEEYQAARRREDKTRLTMEIVVELRRYSRFLLKDPKSQLWFEVDQEYMKEKVSHALRSRPNEERRKRPKPKKKTIRKQQQSPAIDEAVESLIQEQQALLKSMIEREGAMGGVGVGVASVIAATTATATSFAAAACTVGHE